MDICDGELARRARAGNAGAFALLVERHFPPARALAARLCADPDDVDDIVQEAFLQAFAGLGRLRDPDRCVAGRHHPQHIPLRSPADPADAAG